MKTIRSLLAISILTVANAGNAAVFLYSVTNNGTIGVSPQSPLAGYLNGTVTSEMANINSYAQSANNLATLTTIGTTGVLTFNINTKITTNLGGTQHMNDAVTINGNWDGTTFTATSGGYTIISCEAEPGSAECFLNSFTYESVSGSLTWAGGTIIDDVNLNTAQSVHRKDNFSFSGPLTPPPLETPIPASAWLFGSGLIGLASAARQRINKQ